MLERQSAARGRAPGQAGCAGGARQGHEAEPSPAPKPARAVSGRAEPGFTYLGRPQRRPAAASARWLQLLLLTCSPGTHVSCGRDGGQGCCTGCRDTGSTLTCPGWSPLSPPGRRQLPECRQPRGYRRLPVVHGHPGLPGAIGSKPALGSVAEGAAEHPRSPLPPRTPLPLLPAARQPFPARPAPAQPLPQPCPANPLLQRRQRPCACTSEPRSAPAAATSPQALSHGRSAPRGTALPPGTGAGRALARQT